jgi:hypothetical protein
MFPQFAVSASLFSPRHSRQWAAICNEIICRGYGVTRHKAGGRRIVGGKLEYKQNGIVIDLIERIDEPADNTTAAQQ